MPKLAGCSYVQLSMLQLLGVFVTQPRILRDIKVFHVATKVTNLTTSDGNSPNKLSFAIFPHAVSCFGLMK